ncbi:MAG: V-type ATP synthase subunit E [Candidatus Heimdallarchaeaceae archaeon]
MTVENESLEIITKIKEKTEKKIQQLLKEKEEAIAKIEAKAEEEIKKKREALIAKAKKEAEIALAKEQAIQKLDLDLKLSKQREEIIDEFINKAKSIIEEKVKTKEYEKSLTKIIVESALILDESSLVIFCKKQDKKILTPAFLNKITEKIKKEHKKDINFSLADTFINTIGGVIVETQDKSIRVNNTYEKRIERAVDDLKREIGTMLIS